MGEPKLVHSKSEKNDKSPAASISALCKCAHNISHKYTTSYKHFNNG